MERLLVFKMQMETAGLREWTLERSGPEFREKVVIFASKNGQIRKQRRFHWRSAFNGN